MKKYLLVILILFISFPLLAQESPESAKIRIIDDAGLLTAAEIAGFERRAEEIAGTYNFDLVIVTKTTLDGANMEAYADDYFDYNGYGYGEEGDGCLFLQVTEYRDYQFSTSGKGIKLLDNNNTAFDKLEKDMLKQLKADNYAGAYNTYFDLWEEFLALNAKGRSYNFFHQYFIHSIIAAWILALAIGLYCVSYWKSEMKVLFPAKQADSHFVAQSLSFTQKKDNFLYSNVSKTRRDSASSGSGGGGLRTSSSGRMHGGRSGRY